MARGNDSKAAAAEFRGQYGVMGNAEDLIEANRAAFDAGLRSASLTKENEGIKADLDDSKVADAVEGGEVLDYAVRGDKVIAVVETESGHTYKQVLALADVGGPKNVRTLQSDRLGPHTTNDEVQALAEANAAAKQVIVGARIEAEKIVQEAVRKAHEEASQIAQKAVRDAREGQVEAAEAQTERTGRRRGAGAAGRGQQAEVAKEQASKEDDTGKAEDPTKVGEQK
jgi:hypothetical protein